MREFFYSVFICRVVFVLCASDRVSDGGLFFGPQARILKFQFAFDPLLPGKTGCVEKVIISLSSLPLLELFSCYFFFSTAASIYEISVALAPFFLPMFPYSWKKF